LGFRRRLTAAMKDRNEEAKGYEEIAGRVGHNGFPLHLRGRYAGSADEFDVWAFA
jgi:hypothetical protein